MHFLCKLICLCVLNSQVHILIESFHNIKSKIKSKLLELVTRLLRYKQKSKKVFAQKM